MLKRWILSAIVAAESALRQGRLIGLVVGLVLWSAVASTQTVTVTRNVTLRPDPSSEYAPIRLLTPSEPPLTLLEPTPESGYYHVKTSAGEEGYVYERNVHVVVVAEPSAPAATTIQPGPGVPGSASMVGCGDQLWQHV